MDGNVTIRVPMLPPWECSPNARVHWAARHRAIKRYKEAVYYSALEHKPEQPYEYAEIAVTCIVAQKRVRDADNWAARFKPGQDALVLAGIIARDDTEHLRVMPMQFVVDRSRAPLTVIEVRPR